MTPITAIRKALVPLGVLLVAFVAQKLGVDVNADQSEVVVGAIITAVLTYLIPNG